MIEGYISFALWFITYLVYRMFLFKRELQIVKLSIVHYEQYFM
jgi:hypothetical protein